MFLTSTNTKVYLSLGATDMRKSIDGLSILESEHLVQNPFSGHLFVFCNRRRNMLKILYWDRNGFCLWHKRLEKHTFKWPVSIREVMTIGQRELSWLMDGLDIQEKKAHKSLDFSAVFSGLVTTWATLGGAGLRYWHYRCFWPFAQTVVDNANNTSLTPLVH